jgi:aryl-alcohol dehydrogenase-like predicted oxidoreductase
MTSQLGFGCAFPNSVGEQQVAGLLSGAYDAGIRHFDVAPFYIDGRAEGYLGSFLATHPDATVTTKYGLLPPSRLPLHMKVARIVLGPAVRAIRKKITGPPSPFGRVPLTAKASFRPDEMVRSLHRSLALLKRSYLDLFLLHEAELRDVEHEGLLDSLREQTSGRLIGAFGVAGEAHRVSGVQGERPDFCDVVQFNWDPITHGPQFVNAFQIFFRVASRHDRGLQQKFAQDRQLARHWSDGVGLDLSDVRNVRAIMLKVALVTNPDGVILTTSTNVKHILENVTIAEDPSLEGPALQFKKMAAQETI